MVRREFREGLEVGRGRARKWWLWGFTLSGSEGEGNRHTGRCVDGEGSGDGKGGTS